MTSHYRYDTFGQLINVQCSSTSPVLFQIRILVAELFTSYCSRNFAPGNTVTLSARGDSIT